MWSCCRHEPALQHVLYSWCESHSSLLPCYVHFLQAATSGKWSELLSAAPVVTVTGSNTFENVLELLAVKGLHRVYVVDAAGNPVSIITLTDVLRLITKAPVVPPQPVQAMEEDEDEDDDDDDDDEE